MNAFWDYFWPVFAFGVVIGGILGSIALRRRRRYVFALALVVVLAGAALWHGPLGAAHRLTSEVERNAHVALVDWEMTQVRAQLHHDPLTRRLMLAGPADDFQRSELVRILSAIPGVSNATWSANGGWPLVAEAGVAAVLGFLLGLLLAYVVELRRRHNAQWTW